jgi:site-specific DNA-methyltransferase (adenine-specific)
MNVVYNMDCMEYMKTLPDKAFELAIVDPPYGIGEDASHNATGDRPTAKWKNPNSVKYKTFDDAKPPDNEYFNELFRVSKNQIVWGGNHFSDKLPIKTGWVVWDKKADIKECLSMCELAWSSFDIKCNKFEFLWAGFKKQIQEQRIHPTQKPVALYEWLLTHYAKPGDKILDTHLGSGSSRIAAYNLGFDFVGCEIDKDYFDAQEERFAAHTAQTSLFDGEGL